MTSVVKCCFFPSRDTFEAFGSGPQGTEYLCDASSISSAAEKDAYKYTRYVQGYFIFHIINDHIC